MTKTKPLIFRLKNTDYEFVKPNFLMPVNSLILIKAKVKGSTLVWNIEGETISYNQIKKLISEKPLTSKIKASLRTGRLF